MTKKHYLAIALCLLLLLGFFVAAAPARLLPTLMSGSGVKATVSNPQGTLWQGRAAAVWLEINNQTLMLGPVDWDVSVLSLLVLQPSVELRAMLGRDSLSGEVSAGPSGRIELGQLRGQIPLSALEPWLPIRLGGKPLLDGNLVLDIEELAYHSAGNGNGQGKVEAIQGLVQLNSVIWRGGNRTIPLGDYQAELSMDVADIVAQISDNNAALGVQGLIRLTPERRYQFDATLHEGETLAPEVFQSLAWFGKKQGERQIVISNSGQL